PGTLAFQSSAFYQRQLDVLRLSITKRDGDAARLHALQELGILKLALLEIIDRDGEIALSGRQRAQAEQTVLVDARRAHASRGKRPEGGILGKQNHAGGGRRLPARSHGAGEL